MGKAGHSGRSGRGGQVSRGNAETGGARPRAASRLLAAAGIRHGFGLPSDLPDDARRPRQVHGRRIVHSDELPRPGDDGPSSSVEADGSVSKTGGPASAVVAADCVPLLLAAPGGSAVAAVHAGWRGVAAGIVEGAVAALLRQTGGGPMSADLLAALGPSASGCCYEVGPEVVERLGLTPGDAPAVSEGPGGRPHVDLRAAIRARLLGAGLDARRIERVGPCTVCSASWPSYRRDGVQADRLAAWIAPS